jgi:2-methylaconitate cis-trans-isomerase PrpF
MSVDARIAVPPGGQHQLDYVLVADADGIDSRPANAGGEVRVANPSGLVSVGAVVQRADEIWLADSAVPFRTARRPTQGDVAVPFVT